MVNVLGLSIRFHHKHCDCDTSNMVLYNAQSGAFMYASIFMADVASQAGDADSTRAPGPTSKFQGSMNVHNYALSIDLCHSDSDDDSKSVICILRYIAGLAKVQCIWNQHINWQYTIVSHFLKSFCYSPSPLWLLIMFMLWIPFRRFQTHDKANTLFRRIYQNGTVIFDTLVLNVRFFFLYMLCKFHTVINMRPRSLWVSFVCSFGRLVCLSRLFFIYFGWKWEPYNLSWNYLRATFSRIF